MARRITKTLVVCHHETQTDCDAHTPLAVKCKILSFILVTCRADDCYDDSDNDMFEAADFDGGDEMDAIATQEVRYGDEPSVDMSEMDACASSR